MEEHVAKRQMLEQAMEHLTSAIDKLDAASAPAQIAAHLDLARHQLQDALNREETGARTQMDRNAEPQ